MKSSYRAIGKNKPLLFSSNWAFCHQDEAGKSKRVQSIGELPGLAPTVGSPHGRPSIGAINTSDSQELEDGVASLTVNVADASSNKSPLNASTSECFVVWKVGLLSGTAST